MSTRPTCTYCDLMWFRVVNTVVLCSSTIRTGDLTSCHGIRFLDRVRNAAFKLERGWYFLLFLKKKITVLSYCSVMCDLGKT